MPSTTNSLESMHGQLNHNVPRHNNFWNAIYKLANHFMMKTHTTQDHIKHNYLFEKRQTIAHSLRISLRIEDEIVKYKTSQDHAIVAGTNYFPPYMELTSRAATGFTKENLFHRFLLLNICLNLIQWN